MGIFSLLTVLSNGHVDRNTHIFNLNECAPEEMPRVQTETSVAEFFYTMRVEDIPDFEYNEADNTVKLPQGKLWTGWYYHNAKADGWDDAGVFEWWGFPNPISLFPDSNFGLTENLMTVKKDGEMFQKIQSDMAKMQKKTEDNHKWQAPHGEDYKRRIDVNTMTGLTGAAQQFAGLSFDPKQTQYVKDNPEPLPDFSEVRQKLAENTAGLQLPWGPQELKVATNCLHGLSPDVTEEHFVIELDKELIHYKGQTLFAFRIWTNVAGRASWVYDKKAGTLELYYRVFSMGHLDASEFPKKVTYFQGPPHMKVDGRLNEYAPREPLQLPAYPWCEIPAKLEEIPWDTHLFWEDEELVCPDEMLDEMLKIVVETDFSTLVVDPTDMVKSAKLVKVASDYVQCAGRYLRSYIPYSHGYDFLEASAFLHFLMEQWPAFVKDIIRNPKLNRYEVDYVYGDEMPEYGSDEGNSVSYKAKSVSDRGESASDEYESVFLTYFPWLGASLTQGQVFNSINLLAVIGVLSIIYNIFKCISGGKMINVQFEAVPDLDEI